MGVWSDQHSNANEALNGKSLIREPFIPKLDSMVLELSKNVIVLSNQASLLCKENQRMTDELQRAKMCQKRSQLELKHVRHLYAKLRQELDSEREKRSVVIETKHSDNKELIDKNLIEPALPPQNHCHYCCYAKHAMKCKNEL